MERVLRIWVARREPEVLFSCLCYFCRAESTPREPDAASGAPAVKFRTKATTSSIGQRAKRSWPRSPSTARISHPGQAPAGLNCSLPRRLIHIKAAPGLACNSFRVMRNLIIQALCGLLLYSPARAEVLYVRPDDGPPKAEYLWHDEVIRDPASAKAAIGIVKTANGSRRSSRSPIPPVTSAPICRP